METSQIAFDFRFIQRMSATTTCGLPDRFILRFKDLHLNHGPAEQI